MPCPAMIRTPVIGSVGQSLNRDTAALEFNIRVSEFPHSAHERGDCCVRNMQGPCPYTTKQSYGLCNRDILNCL